MGGCGLENGDSAGSTIRVGVAASLGPWMEEFAREYEKGHPDVRFEISAGGSNVITRQALAGAPFDIIVLASTELMDRIDSADRILPGTRRVIGSNTLCLIVPENDFTPKTLADLASPEIQRIGIGSPGVPAGDYARESLERSHLADRFNDRFVYGANVRQLLTWVEAGEVDCAFVYLSDTVSAENIRVAFPIDSTLHTPITYEAAALLAGEHSEVSRKIIGEFRIEN